MSVPGRGTPAAAPAAPVTASNERRVGERDEFGPVSAAKLGGDLLRAAAFARRLGGLARQPYAENLRRAGVEVELRRYSGTIRGSSR
jgi:hypothetical protein